MTDQPEVTFYALLTDAGEPTGLVRRTHLLLVPRDESLRRDLSWQPTEFLRKYWLGHNDNDYREISVDEAEALVDHWRVKWAREDADGRNG